MRLGFVAREPHRGEDADGLFVQTPAGELERAGGGSVEPLDVVDGDEHRADGREDAKAAQEGGRDRPVVGRCAVRFLEQERDLQRPPLRRRQPGQRHFEDVAEQIREPGETELCLRLARPGGENREAALLGPLDSLSPEPGLADPRLALEEEPAGSSLETREEPVQACELRLPADEGLRPGSPLDRSARLSGPQAG